MPEGGRLEREKKAAAEQAADLAEDGMTVGLGTGTTVAYLLPALAARKLTLRCVATSTATRDAARRLGLHVTDFRGIDRLDLAIDGADQVSPDRWLVKGGGGAHTREKIVAAATDRFVVIISSDKLVGRLVPPVPLELLAFGLEATLLSVESAGARVAVRPGAARTPDGGVIADWFGSIDDASALSAQLERIPGVVGHGLFPPSLVSEVIVGRVS